MASRSGKALCLFGRAHIPFLYRCLYNSSRAFSSCALEYPGQGSVNANDRQLSTVNGAAQTQSDPLQEQRQKYCGVGSRLAGFYTAGKILKLYDNASADIVERLLCPFGLVRSGVAPDHPQTKSAINQFSRAAAQHQVDFFGNVELGRHISQQQYLPLYHGAQNLLPQSSALNQISYSFVNVAIESSEVENMAYECGRGDKRTKKGKRFKHSYGKLRPSRGEVARRLRAKWEISGPPPGTPMVPVGNVPDKTGL